MFWPVFRYSSPTGPRWQSVTYTTRMFWKTHEKVPHYALSVVVTWLCSTYGSQNGRISSTKNFMTKTERKNKSDKKREERMFRQCISLLYVSDHQDLATSTHTIFTFIWLYGRYTIQSIKCTSLSYTKPSRTMSYVNLKWTLANHFTSMTSHTKWHALYITSLWNNIST